MNKKYSEELKEKVIMQHLKYGRSKLSLEKEYNLSKGCVTNWVKSYSKVDWIYVNILDTKSRPFRLTY